MESAVSVIQAFVFGISEAIPEIATAAVEVGTAIVEGILETLPDIADAAAELVLSLATDLRMPSQTWCRHSMSVSRV